MPETFSSGHSRGSSLLDLSLHGSTNPLHRGSPSTGSAGRLSDADPGD
jgi:hypothetical protein